MSYKLVLVKPQKAEDKDFGEDIIFDNLPNYYETYIFYYSGPIRNSNLEQKLKEFGAEAGKNSFVNISSIKDPKYKLLASQFEIRRFPVLIMTGIDKLASIQQEGSYSTAFVRLDKKSLLMDINKTLECVANLFTLFITGKISQALQEVRNFERKVIVDRLTRSLMSIIKGIATFLTENDINFSLFEGKLEIKRKNV